MTYSMIAKLVPSRISRAALALGTVGALAVGAAAPAGAAAPRPTRLTVVPAARPVTVGPHLTEAQQRQWRAMTDTATERARVAKVMLDSFTRAGVTVSVAVPDGISAGTSGVTVPMAGRTARFAEPEWTAGVSWDHVWVVLSYQDIARGAIASATGFCATKLPWWICSSMGATLYAFANGWGYAANHGLWAAIYWWPPHYTVGRW